MKKFYLLLLLVFAFGNAQTAVSNYSQCDDDDANDGFALFNLNLQNSVIMANFNVAEHTLQYYLSLSDAESFTNPIPLSEFYTNTVNPQQLFARVTNIQTQESAYFTFNLIVNPRPIAYPAVLNFFCEDPNQTPIFNLYDAVPQILGNQQNNMTVTFFDSALGGNVIAGGNITPNAPVMILGVEISDGTCSERSTITLNTNNDCNFDCPEPNQPIVNLQVDNETINISWNSIANVSAYQLYFAAAGEPAPTANSTPTTVTQATTHFITGLTPNTCYTLYIRSVCDASGSMSLSQWVGPAQVCTTPPCVSPTFLNVSNVSPYSATLSWNAPSQNGFQVIVLPAGSPAPTPNTPGIAVVQTPQFVMTGLMPNTCYVFYVRSICAGGTFSQYAGPYNFCTQNNCENNGECPDNLTLVAFLDANDNGVKDDGEAQFDMGSFDYEINNSGTILQGYTNYGNFTIFDGNPDNAYDLNFTINPDFAPYYSSTTAFTDTHITAGTGTHTYYFPVTLIQSYNDLQVQLIPAAPPRPGFTYTVYLKFKNRGTANIPSGEIAFIRDDAVSILSTSPVIPINAANGFTSIFTNLAVNEERIIEVSMQVPTIPTVNLGQVVTSTAYVGSNETDAFPSNNAAPLSQIIVGSYDPNDKIESHGGKIAMDTFTTDDYLTYTIQFENTGTASAEFVRVEDLLDAGLNPDSVEMLNASHAYNMRRIGNKLIWNFYNINLPATSSNPTQSHGYVQFKVKPTEGYAVGTMIPNAADIYFDYNPAIVTDTFETQFVATLAAASFDANGFLMYPNPATTFIHLGFKDTTENIATIRVYDVFGKSVKSMINMQSDQTNVDVSQFPSGIYFIEITTKNNLKVIKKLIID